LTSSRETLGLRCRRSEIWRVQIRDTRLGRWPRS